MSQRPGVLATHTIQVPKRENPYAADGLPDPVSEVQEVTAEVRAHWPHNATKDQACDAVVLAFVEAIGKVTEWYDNREGVSE